MASVTSVSVTPSALTLTVGSWYYYAKATVYPTSECCNCVTWHSDNECVATVNALTGYIYAKNAGTAKIYATATDGSGKSAYITVTVKSKILITGIYIGGPCRTVEEGSKYTFSVAVYPANATNQNLSWSSKNTNIVRMNGRTMTAVGLGTTTVVAKATDGSGVSASCVVTVAKKNVLVRSIAISPCNFTITEGRSVALTATVCPDTATNKDVNWSSSDTSIVTVNPVSGLVYAKKAGRAVIYADADDGGGARSTCCIAVKEFIRLKKIELSPCEFDIDVGQAKYIGVEFTPSNASNQKLRWQSSDTDIVTVGASDGRVFGKRAGTALITATSEDGGHKSESIVHVHQTLTYPDTLIEHQSTRDAIIRVKTLIDENEKAYLKGKISSCTAELIRKQLNEQYDLIRADYIAAESNPTSDYAYAVLKGDKSATVPSSFPQNLSIGSKGLAVTVLQRTLQVLGYLDYEQEPISYGKFDDRTYEAANKYPDLLTFDQKTSQYVFDSRSFGIIFHPNNDQRRKYERYSELNRAAFAHDQVAIQVASMVGGTFRRKINKIKNGNKDHNRYGYADVLLDTHSVGSYIWEVKPDKEPYYKQGGIGEDQLQRYKDAVDDFDQNFTKPFLTGFRIDNFQIENFFDGYINVRSFVAPSPTDIRNALILYKVEKGEPDPGLVPVPVPIPEDEKEHQFQFEVPHVFENLQPNYGAVAGILVVAGIVCIVLIAGKIMAALPLVAAFA